MKVTTIIRIIASLVICWMVYQETGVWTGIFALLVLTGVELNALSIMMLNRRVNHQIKIIDIFGGFGTEEERESAARAVAKLARDGMDGTI